MRQSMDQESIASNNYDDARKKRESRSSPTPKDKAKKFRTTLDESNTNDKKDESSAAATSEDDHVSSPIAEQQGNVQQQQQQQQRKQHMNPQPSQIAGEKTEAAAIATNTAATSNKPCPLWDLETALHRLVGDEASTKEYLTETSAGSEDGDYITFRWAHAGDAANIAAWYRGQSVSSSSPYNNDSSSNSNNANNKSASTGISTSSSSASKKKDDDNNDDSPLELWLSDGLGDEDHPPFLFALLAHVVISSSSPVSTTNSNNATTTKTPQLAACALLTLAWEEGKRLLRVEWRHVDSSLPHSDLIGRRLWLRLSSLALMSACTLAIEKDIIAYDTDPTKQ